MDNTSNMQALILSDIRRLAYRFLMTGRRGVRGIWSGFDRQLTATCRRFHPTAACLLGAAAAMLLMPACKPKPAASGDIWARVDGHPIFSSQVEKIYKSRAGSAGETGDSEEALSYKLNILNELINNRILMAHAAQSGITVSESEIDTKMGQLKSPYSQEQFEQKLKERGISEDDLRDEVRTTLTVNKLINRDVSARVSVSDADISAFYQKNKTSFDIPETEYHLAQIQVTPGSSNEVHNLKNDDAKTPEMAQRKIQALYAQLRAGQDFAAVAQNYSEDPNTAMSGGDMGFVPESSLAANPALGRVVKGLKPGQISGIMNTPSGYHIIKLLGIEQPGQHPLTDPKVQSQIRKTLQNEKEQLLKAAYIETLRDSAKVKNLLAEQIVKRAQ
ncbi:MAG: peptidylprolyl isomerase [Acidobacteria bacterium]|nr:MAG: peptidylprolyl isomerase [Acidobacteriota bacterium]